MPLTLKLSSLLLLLCGLSQTATQQRPKQKDLKTAPPRWAVLFRSDDPAHWDDNIKNAKGEQIAIPLRMAPKSFRYLRLRRTDTFDTLILPLTRDDLENSVIPSPDTGFWWNGTSKLDWKGRHLGIVQGPKHKFPAPRGMIGVMTIKWDVYTGSGFGHKCSVNDKQYYCWQGKEIPRTTFEIAVSSGPLNDEEKAWLVSKP